MTLIQVHRTPICPLCDKRMRRVLTIKGEFFACTTKGCMISCRVEDPHVEFWNQKSIPCPVCRKNLKYFSRKDGYFKGRCDVCKIYVESDLPDGPINESIEFDPGNLGE